MQLGTLGYYNLVSWMNKMAAGLRTFTGDPLFAPSADEIPGAHGSPVVLRPGWEFQMIMRLNRLIYIYI